MIKMIQINVINSGYCLLQMAISLVHCWESRTETRVNALGGQVRKETKQHLRLGTNQCICPKCHIYDKSSDFAMNQSHHFLLGSIHWGNSYHLRLWMAPSAAGRQRDLQSHALNRISQHIRFDSLRSRELITRVIDVLSVSVLDRLVVPRNGWITSVVLVSDKGQGNRSDGIWVKGRLQCGWTSQRRGREALDEGTQWGWWK